MISNALGLSAVAALAIFTLGVGFVGAQTPTTTPARPTVLSVKRLYCAKESGPAISELSKVPGVQKVIADHKGHTLTIAPKGTTALTQNDLGSRRRRPNRALSPGDGPAGLRDETATIMPKA